MKSDDWYFSIKTASDKGYANDHGVDEVEDDENDDNDDDDEADDDHV